MKKILFSLFAMLFVWLSFCSATNISDNIHYILSWETTLWTSTSYKNIFDLGEYYTGWVSEWTYCIRFTTDPEWTYWKAYNFWFHSNLNWTPNTVFKVYWNQFWQRFCLISDKRYFNTNATWFVINYQVFDLNELLSKDITCPSQYTSLECQSEYSLIPVSSVDSSYCENNNLCSSLWGGCSWSWDVSRSALYVNNIQHLWKPIINITIPEEIDRDYINTWDSFDLDVVWYNVDYEAMSETLSVQKYRPTSEDFTKVVSILAPYMKILLFLLFAYIVIKRLKKPFSSKLK